MKILFLLLLMAQYMFASNNLNEVLSRDDWISLAKEYIKNHIPYKVKSYKPYKPTLLETPSNIINTTTTPLPESTITEIIVTTESPETTTSFESTSTSFPWDTTTENLLITEPSESTMYMESTTAPYFEYSSTEIYPTTESLESTTFSIESTTPILLSDTRTNIPETTEFPLTTYTSSDSTTTPFPEYTELTTNILESTTTAIPEDTSTNYPNTSEAPETSSQIFEITDYTSTTENPFADLMESSTPSPETSTTENSEITDQPTTESWESTMSDPINTTENPETTSTLLEIIATTPGFDSTTYLSKIEDNFQTDNPESNITVTEPTTTARIANHVEDFKNDKPKKYRYNSDTEPEMYWY
ncbi:hypothetical protein KR067_006402 [Drosophila pandora]|nr:hypothetical protein KR067_006402 [Drosophila pandora]